MCDFRLTKRIGILYNLVMTVFDALFLINFIAMVGITIYHCYRKQPKTVIYNFFVLSFFIFIKIAEVYYIEIRAELLELLGEQKFGILRNILGIFLFFGSSVTIGIQVFSDLIEILVIVALAAKLAVIVANKCKKKVFSSSVTPDNEYAINKNRKPQYRCLYLAYERLIN